MFRRRRQSSDLRQALDQFLGTVPQDAPIRKVISSKPIEEELKAFDQADDVALRKQASYRRGGRFALWAGVIAAVVWAILLFPMEGLVSEPLLQGMGALRFFFLILMFLAIWWVSARGSLVKWMDERTKAERIRGDVMRGLIEASADRSELLSQALACFKFAHLDWQLGFFKKRVREHDVTDRQQDPYRNLARFFKGAAVVFGAIAGINIIEALGYSLPFLSGPFHVSHAHRWEAGLSALGSCVLAFVSARASLDRGALVAAFYALAAADLEKLKSEQLPKAEAAAESGNVRDVLAFADQVQNALDTEHRVWRVVGKGSVKPPN